MALFSISDLHLSLSVSKPMDIFGYRWQGYTEKLEKAWRSIVTDDDTVIIPGDVSWAMRLDEALADFRFIDSLPGKKLLGKGNHDYWWQTLTKMRRYLSENGISSIDFLYNNAYVTEGHVVCGTRGWFIEERLQNDKAADYDLICRRELGRLKASLDSAIALSKAYEGEALPLIVYLHFPPVFGDFVCDEFVSLMTEYGVARCFYGHIHGVYGIPPVIEYGGLKMEIISADYLNFIPKLTKITE